MLARFIDAPIAEVTLRLPPPLGRPLAVERAGNTVRLLDGKTLVAQGRSIDDLGLGQLRDPAPLEEAARARERAAHVRAELSLGCFVCGPQRAPGDGLRIFAGPISGGEAVASPWEVTESVPGEDGIVRSEVVWAALDCPSGHAVSLLPDYRVPVLGRLAARLDAPVEVGITYVVVAWPLAREGRKIDTASVVFDASGRDVARARARWIELQGQDP